MTGRSLPALPVSLKRLPVLTVNRIAIDDAKLVYFLCADIKLDYGKHSSSVVYIGTTQNGLNRVAQSAAKHAADVLKRYKNINSLVTRIATCKPRRGVATWEVLERAFLIAFQSRYGELPCCNRRGPGPAVTNEFAMFSKRQLISVLINLERAGEAEEVVIL